MKTVWAALAWAVLTLPPTLWAAPADFVVANHSEPQTLDPARASSPAERRIVGALFEGLVGYTARGGAQPALALKWTVSKDGRTYLFTLRKSIWSDGTSVTASTVKASWQRVLDGPTASPRSDLAREFLDADQVVVVDAQTLKVTFRRPLPALSLLADPVFAVVPIHVVARYGEEWSLANHLVVNGPFQLETWSPGDRVTVVPNLRYWDRRAVKLARITFLPLEDLVAYRLYRKERLDWVPVDALARVPDEAPALRGYHGTPIPAVNYLRLNTLRPGLDDGRVRRALSLAIDRTALSQRVPEASLSPLYSFSPPLPGYVAPKFAPKDDAKVAQTLLADAGFPGGQNFPSLTILYSTSDKNRAVAEFVRDQWVRNLGIPVEIRGADWKNYGADRDALAYDVARSGWSADYNDPLTFLELWTSHHRENDTGYSNPAYDALVQRAEAMDGGPTRTKLLTQAEALLVSDLPFVPLGTELKGQLIDLKRWSGWSMNALDVHPWKEIGPGR